MVDIQKKEKCCGCHACYNCCPKHCITMEADEEGFLYPHVDETQCIHCGLCERVCIMQYLPKQAEVPKAYAAYALDDSIRVQSSSGGIFPLLARYVIQNEGIVCGAAFNPDDYSVSHIFVEDVESIKRLMSSKYLQSCIGDCYKLIKQYLEAGRMVLFAGTPCQINGLKLYLGKEYDSLICQDIICHGVPSGKVWKIYLAYLEKKNKSTIAYKSTVSFRDKSDGWAGYAMSVPLENGTYRCVVYKDPYLRGFIHNLFLRPSCYACRSKGLTRCADITLADFWGIRNCCPEMYDEMGVSLVLTYTEKGQKIWKELETEIKCKEVEWQDAINRNPSASRPATRPDVREHFYDKANRNNFGRLVLNNTGKSLTARVVDKMKKLVKSSR